MFSCPVRVKPEPSPPAPTTRLGDWYASTFNVRWIRLVMSELTVGKAANLSVLSSTQDFKRMARYDVPEAPSLLHVSRAR